MSDDARWRRQALVMGSWALPNAFMVSLINIALPEIQAEFGVGAGALTWAASGYIVAGAIGAVIYGRLADVFGLRRIALGCLTVFAAMSLAVALAPSYAWLVAFRVPQGLVGMALPAVGLGGMMYMLPPQHRTRAVGLIMALFGLGLVAGSLAGGLMIELAGWRAPFVAVAALALLLVAPSLAALPPLAPSADPPRFDKAGGALVTVAVGGTLLAANQLPRADGHAVGLAAGVVALFFWIVFLVHIRRARHPFIDPVALANAPFLRSCALGGLLQGQFVLAGFVFPLALTRLFGYSVGEVGLLMSAGFVTVLAFGVTGPRIAGRLGARGTLFLAAAFSVAGAAGCALAGVDSVVAAAVLYAFLGAAYAIAQPVLLNAAGRLLPAEYSGAGMGFYNFAYFAAGAFCVALAGGIIERSDHASALLVLPALAAVEAAVLLRLLRDPGFDR